MGYTKVSSSLSQKYKTSVEVIGNEKLTGLLCFGITDFCKKVLKCGRPGLDKRLKGELAKNVLEQKRRKMWKD
jgi:hypothetical protein